MPAWQSHTAIQDKRGITMIESKTITISIELSYHNVGQLLYGRAYYIWDCADRHLARDSEVRRGIGRSTRFGSDM